MRVIINQTEVVIPSSLAEITLGQRIDFHLQHGADLDKMLASILKMDEGPVKELELTNFHFEKMFRSFAFFSGFDVESIKESKFIDDVASIYYSCLQVLLDDEENLEPVREFLFKGELWELQPPEVLQGSKMKYGEFIDSKQLVKDMVEVGAGKWEYMLPICAIYLRKKGELYQEEFLYEGSDRLQLMRDLPMNIAMQVGFFLTSTMNIYQNTLRSSGNLEQKVAESSPKRISKDTVGSIF
jgi:hypothetical protein